MAFCRKNVTINSGFDFLTLEKLVGVARYLNPVFVGGTAIGGGDGDAVFHDLLIRAEVGQCLPTMIGKLEIENGSRHGGAAMGNRHSLDFIDGFIEHFAQISCADL